MKYLRILLILIILYQPSCKKERHPSPSPCDMGQLPDNSMHPKNSKYQAALEKHLRINDIPGGILLVKKQGEPMWIGAAGKADLENNITMATCNLFRINSVTKMLVATLIMKLKEEGKVRLTDPLSMHLPELKAKIPQADKITIAQMLSHTSGIPTYGGENQEYLLDIIDHPEQMYAMSLDEVLAKYVYGRNLYFEPGTAWSYANSNYDLLGKVLEKYYHKPVDAIVAERIFIPLGMSQSYLTKRSDENVVPGYRDLYDNGQLLNTRLYDRISDGRPSGGVIAPITDVYKFLEGLFKGKFITLSSVEEMKRSVMLPSCPDGDCEYGLGLERWDVQAGKAWGHGGDNFGIENVPLYFPTKDGYFILFTNGGPAKNKSIIDEIMKD